MYNLFNRKIILMVIVTVLISGRSFSQPDFEIIGATVVSPGMETVYSVSDAWFCPITWIVNNGVFIDDDGNIIPGASISTTPLHPNVLVRWNCISGGGTGTITVQTNLLGFWCPNFNQTLNVTIQDLNPNLQVNAIDGDEYPYLNDEEIYELNTAGCDANSFIWTVTSGEILSGQGTNALSVRWNSAGTGTLSVVPSLNNCQGTPQTKTVTIQNIEITGLSQVCGGQYADYDVSSLDNVQSYTWSYPTGVSGPSGPFSELSSVIASFGPYASSGNISVTIAFNDGDVTTIQHYVTVDPPFPSPIGDIIGKKAVCAAETTFYYIAPVQNATTYTWNVTNGIITEQGTTSISVTWDSPGTGTLSVTAFNSCTACIGWVSQTTDVIIHESYSGPDFTLVTYNDADLASQVNKQLIKNHCSAGATCLQDIKEAELNIKFNLGQDYNYGNNPWNAYVNVSITGYSDILMTNPVVSYSAELSINEDQPEKLFSVNYTDDYYQVCVFKVSISDYSSSSLVAGDITLDVYYSEILGDYTNTPPACASAGPLFTGSDLYKFEWTHPCPVSNWVFQLLRLYNKEPDNINTLTTIECYVDWNKALTIETQSPEKNLILRIAEGTGYYIWRVMPIGTYFEGGFANSLNYGQWSLCGNFIQDETVNITTAISPYSFFYTHAEENKNWIYSRIFTEGDPEESQQVRMAENISYANGLQQVQQTMSDIRSDDKVLVTQTIYDYSGRPVINTLPVPVDGESFEYKNGLVKNLDGNVYAPEDFDEDNTVKSPIAVRDVTGDVFSYYSDNNSDEHVPTAEGYPYTRNLYYNDASGRIKEQGGAGDVHRIRDDAASRTIKTYYSGVSEEELIRIFGDEAPRASSVYKIISVDPNNVTSATYISKEGKTIATCLVYNSDNTYQEDPDAGDQELIGLQLPTPDNFDINYEIPETVPLSSFSNAKTTTVTVSNPPQTINLYYSITPKTIEDECQSYCEICDYIVDFYIFNAENPGSPVFSYSKTYEPGDICTETVQLLTPSLSYIVTEPGTYYISRIIRTGTSDETIAPDTYLEHELNTLSDQYISEINTELQNIYDYLDANNLDGLYTYLDDEYQYVNFDVNDPDPDVTYENDSLPIHISCTDINIPILLCNTGDCDATKFEKYFVSVWESTHPEYIDGNNNNFYDFLGDNYSDGQFNTVISEMIALNNTNPDVPDYNCEHLWECWTSLVNSYSEMLELQAEIQEQQPGLVYEFDLLEAFLNCTGRYLLGASTTPTGNNGYISHPYSYFYYDHENTPNLLCEGWACGAVDQYTGCTDQQFGYNWLQADWENFYNCINNMNNTGSLTVNSDESADEIMSNCEMTCEERRYSFRQELIQMYHDNQLYIEGDQYTLVSDSVYSYVHDPVTGEPMIDPVTNEYMTEIDTEQSHWIPDQTLPYYGSYDISQHQLNCMIEALVAYCKQGCNMTVVYDGAGVITSVGTDAEILAMQQSTQWGYDIDLPPCEGSETTIDPSLLVTGFNSFDNITMGQDYIHGGTDEDILYSAIRTHNQVGYLLGGYSKSRNSSGPPDNGNKDLDKLNTSLDDYDFWLVKLDDHYNQEWEAVLGGRQDDFLYSMVQTDDGGYVLVGASSSGEFPNFKTAPNLGDFDMWVVKISATGALVWDKSFGGTGYDDARDVIIDSDGNIIIAGNTLSPGLGETGSNYYIVALDPLGGLLWQKVFSSKETDILRSIIQTSDGNYVVAGYSNGIKCCDKSEHSIGLNDYWIIKFSNIGNHDKKWDRTIGGMFEDKAADIIETSDGRLRILGASNSPSLSEKKDAINFGGYDYWVVELDQEGNKLWDKSYGGNQHEGIYISAGISRDVPMQITELTNGKFILGGSASPGANITSTRHNLGCDGYDYWIVLTNHFGNYLSDRCAGGKLDERFGKLILKNDYEVVLCGSSESNISCIKSQDAFGNESY
ncbi:MAG: hypothetical protein HY738_09985, partial [Bacteroidia bacterium]|nr:hypothetical protein [Bacteroidia bacterium]